MTQAAVFLGLAQLDDSGQTVGPSAWRAERDSSSLRDCAAQIKPSFERSTGGSISYSRPSRTPKVENTIVFGLATRMMYSSTSAA
jgi:hypothetical protein